MTARTLAQLWSRRLQVIAAVCSVVFTIGTTLQNFVVVNLPMLEHTMHLAGLTESQAVVAIPPEVFRATLDLHGPAGLLPTIITDGGALGLVVIMIASLVGHLRRRSSRQPVTP